MIVYLEIVIILNKLFYMKRQESQTAKTTLENPLDNVSFDQEYAKRFKLNSGSHKPVEGSLQRYYYDLGKQDAINKEKRIVKIIKKANRQGYNKDESISDSEYSTDTEQPRRKTKKRKLEKTSQPISNSNYSFSTSFLSNIVYMLSCAVFTIGLNATKTYFSTRQPHVNNNNNLPTTNHVLQKQSNISAPRLGQNDVPKSNQETCENVMYR